MSQRLLLHDGLLYVIDYSFSEFRVFTTQGEPVRTLYTDFEPESLEFGLDRMIESTSMCLGR